MLADEINRSPAKVQSALLEAMQEQQVTLGGQTHKLPEPFMVLATQNPIEQEGTYSLPEAQIDRFMFKLLIEYPTRDEEHEVLRRAAALIPSRALPRWRRSTTSSQCGRRSTPSISTRSSSGIFCAWWPPPATLPGVDWIIWRRSSASGPRPASIYLALAAHGHALLCRRDYVVPDDVKAMLHDVVRHRVAISYRAEAEGLNSDALLDQIVERVPVSEAGAFHAAARH